GPDGREDDWMSSALAVAEQAKRQWVRLVAGGNGYKSLTTSASLPDPVWPGKTFDELLELAFAKRRIASESDPVLRRRGEGVWGSAGWPTARGAGWPPSSPRAARASGPPRSAWRPASCGPAGSSACGATTCAATPGRRSTPARGPCSWPTWRARSWAV